jgi:hypothetical protein
VENGVDVGIKKDPTRFESTIPAAIQATRHARRPMGTQTLWRSGDAKEETSKSNRPILASSIHNRSRLMLGEVALLNESRWWTSHAA